MVYVTHDAEILQFYLWLADYYQRFRAISPRHKALSPKWTGLEVQNYTEHPAHRLRDGEDDGGVTDYMPKATDAEKLGEDDSSLGSSTWEGQQARYSKTLHSMDLSQPALQHLNMSLNIKWQRFAAQPFRAEINRIAFHYIAPGSPRELNLQHEDRVTVLYALQQTTDPSAFTSIKVMLDKYLRNQAHPNFVRWSVCNGNRSRTIFLRCFAFLNITIGFVIAIVLTLSSVSRYWRIFAAIEWWLGILNLFTSYQGLCGILHRMNVRNIRPWELDEKDLQPKSRQEDDEDAAWKDFNIFYDNTKPKWPVKMELFGPANDYSDEKWVNDYSKLSLWKRIENRKVTVRSGGGLGVIQDKIIRQAEAWATIITIVLTVAFCALPKGNLF